MKGHLRLSLLFILVVLLLLTACELPVTHRYRIDFNFIQPYGSTFLVEPIDFEVQLLIPYPPGYRPYYGPGGSPLLNGVTFFANALEIGRAPIIAAESAGTLGDGTRAEIYDASFTWTPPGPGTYYIQAQAILMLGGPVNGDYSDAIRICVLDAATSPRTCGPAALITFTPIPFSAPFSFSTPTFTFTPASALDCPAGTFFAEQTHKCIPIQIVTAKPGSGGANCSQYTTDSSCNADPACSYNYVKKKCESK